MREQMGQGLAAAVVHQGCPVPICNFDIVLTRGVFSIINFKVGELQPQYLSSLHMNSFGPLKVVRVVVRVVW